MSKNFCVNFLCKTFLWVEGTHENLFDTKKVLHGNNFTLSSHHYFLHVYARSIDQLLYKYNIHDGGRDRTRTAKSLLCSWLPRLSRDMGSNCW